MNRGSVADSIDVETVVPARLYALSPPQRTDSGPRHCQDLALGRPLALWRADVRYINDGLQGLLALLLDDTLLERRL